MVDGGALLRNVLARVAAPGAVGLLTARNVRWYELERVERESVIAECVTTVGLGNLLAAGDPTTVPLTPIGRINLICRVSVGLTEEALLEAMASCVPRHQPPWAAQDLPVLAQEGSYAFGSSTARSRSGTRDIASSRVAFRLV